MLSLGNRSMNKETFCAFPFNTIFLGPNGGVRPCCSAREDIGNINDDNLDNIVNGDMIKSIRQSIINNKWHPNCSQCEHLESMGARTERTNVLDKFDEYKDADKETFKLQKVDIRWSNTCNLSCNYCYEYFSSQWAKLKGIKINANKDLAENSVFDFIEKNKDTIESINLLGGEPLLQKQNNKLIEILHDKNYYILTNLSVELEKNPIALKLLDMSSVDWGISFETIGEKFEYVRHGAEWSVFLNNLEILKTKNPKRVNAHPLYCTYTALNLREYFDFILRSEIFFSVLWSAIQNIKGLNVYNLPNSFKEKAIQEIELAEIEYSSDKEKLGIDHLINIKNKLLESLNGKDTNDGLTEFFKWTDELENKFLTKKKCAKDLWPNVYNMGTKKL